MSGLKSELKIFEFRKISDSQSKSTLVSGRINSTGGASPGKKRLGREADHIRLSSVLVLSPQPSWPAQRRIQLLLVETEGKQRRNWKTRITWRGKRTSDLTYHLC